MVELVVHKEAIKTELDNTKMQLNVANLELSNANLEIQKMAKLVVDIKPIKTALTETNVKLYNANLEIQKMAELVVDKEAINTQPGLSPANALVAQRGRSQKNSSARTDPEKCSSSPRIRKARLAHW